MPCTRDSRPIPTICGRSVKAAKNSASSTGRRGLRGRIGQRERARVLVDHVLRGRLERQLPGDRAIEHDPRAVGIRARVDRKSGLTQIEADLTAAYRAEAAAEAVVLLARPRTTAEATAKTAYIYRSCLMREWTESSITLRAVMQGLCSVEEA